MLRPLANCASRSGVLLVRNCLGAQRRKMLTTASRTACSQNTEDASAKEPPESEEQPTAPLQIALEEHKKAIAEKDGVISDLKVSCCPQMTNHLNLSYATIGID